MRFTLFYRELDQGFGVCGPWKPLLTRECHKADDLLDLRTTAKERWEYVVLPYGEEPLLART